MKEASVFASNREKGCREPAVEILLKVERRKAYADILLDHTLKRSSLPAADRALLTQLVYGTLRWRGRIDWYLSQFLHGPLSEIDPYLKNLLRLTLYQILFLDRIPDYAAVNEGVELAKRNRGARSAGLVNGVARNILRERDRLPHPDPITDLPRYLAVLWSHPEWVVRKWLDYFGREDAEALLKADNEELSLTLRVNSLKADRESLLDLLRAKGLDVGPTRWSPQGIQAQSASAVDLIPGFREGLFQVQGEASQLIGYLLAPRPGERVLDACAAPGGKTTHLAELMEDKGEIIATDISARGLEKLKQNVQRLGLKSVRNFRLDVIKGLTGGMALPYDRVLVDAPCSGLGTLRSHPEARWHRSESDIRRLGRLQSEILGRASQYVKAGGVLVYATCTLTREENEDVIEAFLSERGDFVLEKTGAFLPRGAEGLVSGDYLLALPHKHNTDGFFAARMRKVA